MNRALSSSAWHWLGSLWPVLLVLALWQGITAGGLIGPQLLPSPLAIAERLVERLQQPEFLFQISQTLIRLGLGFAIALVAGMLLGAAMALGGERWLGPLVRLLAPVPKIALYPGLVLLFGYGHASKVALVVADVVFPILYATYHGMRSVQPKLVWSARAAGAGAGATILGVLLPSATPSLLTGCRIGLVIACINVFLAEMISSSDGLGHLLIVAARSYQVVDMFVPLVLISLIGLCLASALQWLRNRLPAAAA